MVIVTSLPQWGMLNYNIGVGVMVHESVIYKITFLWSFAIFIISSQCPDPNGACIKDWGFNRLRSGTLSDLSEGGMDEVSIYISVSSHYRSWHNCWLFSA